MYLVTVDENVKNKLIALGCTLISEKSDVNKKYIWCLKKAPDFILDYQSEDLMERFFLLIILDLIFNKNLQFYTYFDIIIKY